MVLNFTSRNTERKKSLDRNIKWPHIIQFKSFTHAGYVTNSGHTELRNTLNMAQLLRAITRLFIPFHQSMIMLKHHEVLASTSMIDNGRWSKVSRRLWTHREVWIGMNWPSEPCLVMPQACFLRKIWAIPIWFYASTCKSLPQFRPVLLVWRIHTKTLGKCMIGSSSHVFHIIHSRTYIHELWKSCLTISSLLQCCYRWALPPEST